MKKRNLGQIQKYVHNTCSFCNKSFLSIEDYENHIVSCQRCCLCNEKYSNKDDLWRHLESKHGIKKVTESFNVDKNTKNITKTHSKEVVINFSRPEPRLSCANSNQLSLIKRAPSQIKCQESFNVDKNTKNIAKTQTKEVVINFSCPEPRLPPANSNQLSPIKRYGNKGCGGFKRGIQNSKDLCPIINMP